MKPLAFPVNVASLTPCGICGITVLPGAGSIATGALQALGYAVPTVTHSYAHNACLAAEEGGAFPSPLAQQRYNEALRSFDEYATAHVGALATIEATLCDARPGGDLVLQFHGFQLVLCVNGTYYITDTSGG